jgi:imidazolonepropionase-like amidohydrolase
MMQSEQRTVFSGGKIFDGTGSSVDSADIAIERGRISAVGSSLDGDVEIDATGLTIMPGFFDCHVHITSSGVDLMAHLQRPFSYQFYQAAHHLSATLDCGITSIRDASGADLGVQQAVNDGLIEGPHMQISISALSQTGGHGDGWMPFGCVVPHSVAHPGRPGGIVDGPEEVRRKVRELIRAGADVIKVFTSGGVLSPRDDPRHAHFRDDELTTLVAEATAAGIFVMAHAQATDGIKSAIRAGIRSIEHGIFLDDEAIEMMIDRGTWLVPTLVAPKAVIDAARAGASIPETSINKALEVMEIHRDSFSRAVRAGVKVAMGTDSGVGPHGNNLEELALMHRGGLSTEQVYHATTGSAAALLGVSHDRGTIEVGKRADLVLIAGELNDFTKLKNNVRSVFKNGQKVRG